MKILAVSDRVLEQLYCSDVRRKYPGVGLVIGCGDLPLYYLEFLVSAFDVCLVFVRGNHDQGPQYTVEGRVLTQVQGGEDIHGRLVKRDGLLLAGLEGSMRYRPGAPFMYTESEMRWEVSRLLPQLLYARLRYGRFLDVLVTHSPPYGIHDRSDLAHTGFQIFNAFMRWFKPRYLLHGHVHIYRHDTVRVSQFEQTTIINVYPYYLLDVKSILDSTA